MCVRPKILIVVDSLFWVTGLMASQIQNRFRDFEIIVCSYQTLEVVLRENNGRFPAHVDLVHYFLYPHAAATYKVFHMESAIVTTIHHVRQDHDTTPLFYSDSIQTVCHQWHTYLTEYASDASALVLVPNGINTSLFRPTRNHSQANRLRARYGIPENAFVVGFSAKRSSDTGSRKGVDVLERLIMKSVEKNTGIWWVIRGPGWQEFVDKLKSNRCPVTYIPFLLPGRELARSYQLLDSYLVTSRIEGGPVPLMEAMSAGLVVISTRVGTALDVLEHGINGFFVPFDDSSSILDQLLFLMQRPKVCADVGAAARKSIQANYTWEKVLDKIPHLYRVGLENYVKRNHQRRTAHPQKGMPFPRVLRKKLRILDLQAACLELQREGCIRGARYYATIGLLEAPFSPSNVKNFLWWSWFGIPYFATLSALKSARQRFSK